MTGSEFPRAHDDGREPERMTMAPTSTMTSEAVALRHFLDAQRATYAGSCST